ncbi:2-hydroxyacid dehydrogenase [Sphingomonas sp. AOB5]|uniref:2-hydroxyacid dehydrogenase n=1 Tax=Sphingomonas sp. AOB5 TaxID=3034017 RepID=UPI0023F76F44|nr:2-hydroxyacid dehydrogenase [Sphingomonas sp. AOB5]MDF7777635.1 2-hydroxyacid dehydrogenase [Sphingomonas sp. AOB5]
MTRPVVAIKPALMPRIEPLAGSRYTLISTDDSGMHSARALVPSGGSEVSAALMDAMPALELIAVHGVGYDGVDLAAAATRGIAVTNTPDVLTGDVADLAIGLMIAACRGIATGDRLVRSGGWATGAPFPLGHRASGRRIGIAGFGRIGKAIARRAEAMDCTIAYTGRHRQPVPHDYYPDLRSLAEAVEILILVLPGGADTDGLVGAEVLDALGPDGILINVGRGNAVNEAALVEALASGRIAGAALDVFAQEPHVPAALLAMDNVVLQPHRGSATIETRTAMAQLVIDNLDAHFAGLPLVTPVT